MSTTAVEPQRVRLDTRGALRLVRPVEANPCDELRADLRRLEALAEKFDRVGEQIRREVAWANGR